MGLVLSCSSKSFTFLGIVIESFAKTLASEKRYFESYVKHGLNDPRTHENKYKLNIAVDKFERDTGIKWPYK